MKKHHWFLTTRGIAAVRQATGWRSSSTHAACCSTLATSYKNEEPINDTLDQYSVRPRLKALRETLRNEKQQQQQQQPPALLNVKLNYHGRSTSDPSHQNARIAATSPSSSSSSSSSSLLHASSFVAYPQTRNEWKTLVQQLPDPPPQDQILTDSFHRRHSYLRISLSERCNLRCTYCMPEEGVPLQPAAQLLQTEEILTLANYFVQRGVTKFRLTGGEPTLRKDLVTIVQGLAQFQQPHNTQQIGMTTNGITLMKHLDALMDAGMNSINISLDTLEADRFANLTRRPIAYFDKVWQSIHAAHEYAKQGQLKLKLNCVIMRGINDDEVHDFLQLLDTFPSLQIRFIEYMPFDKNGWQTEKYVPYQELLQRLPDGELSPLSPHDKHDTTKWFAYNRSDVAQVGFITSMSQPFCAGCNRLRLTADGMIKICLFDGVTHVSLRDAIRVGHLSDQEMDRLLYAVVQTKHAKLGGHASPQELLEDASSNRPMTLIGG